MADATFLGLLGLSGGGAREVFTAQNEYPQPIIMVVAVVVLPLLPPQHSPMFGHLDSSQTYLLLIFII